MQPSGGPGVGGPESGGGGPESGGRGQPLIERVAQLDEVKELIYGAEAGSATLQPCQALAELFLAPRQHAGDLLGELETLWQCSPGPQGRQVELLWAAVPLPS